jgi:hypothetical protein
MLKEISFYADFGKRYGVTHKTKKQNLRRILHGTQKITVFSRWPDAPIGF